jgi:crotonobetainyl-CoA:carnitine CoA-transferase CaiB-like acyl-CoA transferase
MFLSDLGAEVIKVEKPGDESTRWSAPVVDGQSIYFNVYNRGKTSICLRTPGRAGPVPIASEHTEEILGALESCGPAGLDELRTRGVI